MPASSQRPLPGVTLAQAVLVGVPVGVVCGVCCAVFLFLLDHVTGYRNSHPSLVYALPLAGLLMGAVLERYGKPMRGGTNLVLDALHGDGPQIPLRLAPMVLLGTLWTHLFGGSAGREGTAVQMGASLADAAALRLHVTPGTRKAMLVAGVAGGFGAVFGTPVAGAVFALEFMAVGLVKYDLLSLALVASILGDLTTRALGIEHTLFPTLQALPFTPLLLPRWFLFAAAVATTTVAYVELTHAFKARLERWVPRLPLRMALGGVAVVGLWLCVDSQDYLGLGIPMLRGSFGDDLLPPYAFALKLVFTAVTLASGFLGGEVTPLFVVGATLGNALAPLLGLPLPMAVGVGMAGVFAAAANAPLALSIMAVELLGAHVLPHVVLVCGMAYLLTGHRGIYASQRLARAKTGGACAGAPRLEEWEHTSPASTTQEPPP